MKEIDTMSITDNKEIEKVIKVMEIDALGYGTEESKISYKKQIENGELKPEVAKYGAELIRNGECMLEITEKDDGCIDGRPAIEILFVNSEGILATREIIDASNHERAKVAGGGYITTLAMKRALDVPAGTIDEDLRDVASTLAKEKVFCGAHTGKHGKGETTDCGANDRIQPIFGNGILYRSEITDSTTALLNIAGIEYSPAVGEKVYNGWSETLTNEAYFTGSTGATRFTVIEDALRDAQQSVGDYEKPVAVSKHLDGDHKEDFVVVNYIEGRTFSQRLFAEKMRAKFPEIPEEQLAQVFVIDVPRIIELAKAFTKNRENSEDDFQVALYAGVKYQLSTAATLTDGSLRTFIVNE